MLSEEIHGVTSFDQTSMVYVHNSTVMILIVRKEKSMGVFLSETFAGVTGKTQLSRKHEFRLVRIQMEKYPKTEIMIYESVFRIVFLTCIYQKVLLFRKGITLIVPQCTLETPDSRLLIRNRNTLQKTHSYTEEMCAWTFSKIMVV